MMEGAGTSATTTTNNNIASSKPTVNNKNSLSPADDIGPVHGGIYGKDIALDDDIPIRSDIRTDPLGADEIAPPLGGRTEQTAGEQERVAEQKAAPSTVQERLERKIENTQAELDKNRQFQDEAIKDYDEEIARAQAELDANGNPDIPKADVIHDELETKYDHNEALLKKEFQKLKVPLKFPAAFMY